MALTEATLGSIISGGAALGGAAISGIASGKMNKKSVRYNKWALKQSQNFSAQQAQLGRDWSEEMLARQNQFSLDQWNRENEYNLPVNQKLRLFAAGINPYLAMNGSASVGQGASLRAGSSAPSASAPSAPGALPFNYSLPSYGHSFEQISSAVNSYFQNRKSATETHSVGLDNLLKVRYGDTEKQLNLGKTAAEIDDLRASTANRYAQSALVNLQAKEKEVLNRYLDAGQQLGLAVKLGELATMKSQRELMSVQTRKTIADELESYARANGLKISNRIASETSESLIKAVNAENEFRRVSFRESLGWEKERQSMEREQMSVDLGMSKVQKALAEFDEYITNTPGNRWIKKNISPITGILGDLVGIGASVAGAKASLGKSSYFKSAAKSASRR